MILSKKLHLIRSVQKLDEAYLKMQVVEISGLMYVVWELTGFKYGRKKHDFQFQGL